MKIHLKYGDASFKFERPPMEQERFTALCKLAGFAVCGGAVVATTYLLGVWGLIWPLAALVLAFVVQSV